MPTQWASLKDHVGGFGAISADKIIKLGGGCIVFLRYAKAHALSLSARTPKEET